jgi:hypothetical protein
MRTGSVRDTFRRCSVMPGVVLALVELLAVVDYSRTQSSRN